MNEEIMSFYLRIEAVNLGHFIMDTNDLSTIRGGSLLLLEAMEKVEEIIRSNLPKIESPIQQEINGLQSKLDGLKNLTNKNESDKNKIGKLKKQIKSREEQINKIPNLDSKPTITKGASWGLFELEVSETLASNIQKSVSTFFKTDIRYKHATFVIDLQPSHGEKAYQTDRNILQTLNRWQQMQSPSLAICKEGKTSCRVDKMRVANEEKKIKDEKRDYVSESVYQRREYGKEQKHTFYKKITDIDNNTSFTNDLTTLSKAENQGILDGKIAFIYIDGNDFGKKQRESKTPEAQRAFDQNTRKGRENVLKNILTQIKDNPDWLTRDNKIRLETLLWGGDEIIWVVPAWQGWWMVNEFYQQAKQHIKHDSKLLSHATGLVFCHHNAPIHRIDALARNLAEYAKADRTKNLIAYQILESFDHAGAQLRHFRESRINNLGQPGHLLVEAENIGSIKQSIIELKKDEEFAKRKIYQILHAYRTEDTQKAQDYIDKLSANSKQPIETLKKLFAGDNAHWLHLMDLWDYFDKGNA